MAQIVDDVLVFGPPTPEAVEQITRCRTTGSVAALMADHHVGYSMPIGGVVAYPDKVSPSGVGFDIGCGNTAVRLDSPLGHVKANIAAIMDTIFDEISFGIGMKNKETVDDPIFEHGGHPAWDIAPAKTLKRLAEGQLGTVGSGNHYVDVFEDEEGRVWVGVHFGSRGFGHKIATHYIKAAGGEDGMHVAPALLDVDSDLGREYRACMELAGLLAEKGRKWVCGKVAQIIGGGVEDVVNNHHNFSWEEEHNGQTYHVVRKGSTPSFPGQRSFVGGSMGDKSYIVRGKDTDENKQALYSTIHGAGRVMSRTRAAGKWRRKRGRRILKKPGEISLDMMHEWIRPMGVQLRGGGTDESPHCYRRIDDVIENHEGCIDVMHTLTPLGVAMAGADVFDPYKD